jgi:16S rRNA (guanine966-N2)-methyltransferase
MRVIAGAYRGLRLRTLKGEMLRPTSDRLRETLFDILGNSVHAAAFLDMYAGSGAVGIEALSRGAGLVVFIESHRPATEIIRQNLRVLGVVTGFTLLTAKVEVGIERLEQDGINFDFVFLDPPYAHVADYHHSLRKLSRSSVVSTGSVVIAEHSRHTQLEERYGRLVLTRLLRQGESQLAFYRPLQPI